MAGDFLSFLLSIYSHLLQHVGRFQKEESWDTTGKLGVKGQSSVWNTVGSRESSLRKEWRIQKNHSRNAVRCRLLAVGCLVASDSSRSCTSSLVSIFLVGGGQSFKLGFFSVYLFPGNMWSFFPFKMVAMDQNKYINILTHLASVYTSPLRVIFEHSDAFWASLLLKTWRGIQHAWNWPHCVFVSFPFILSHLLLSPCQFLFFVSSQSNPAHFTFKIILNPYFKLMLITTTPVQWTCFLNFLDWVISVIANLFIYPHSCSFYIWSVQPEWSIWKTILLKLQ